MNLGRLFRRRDPIAPLRSEPTAEQRAALLLEQREMRRADILRSAPVSLGFYTNVAHGTWGYEVLSMARDGLLEDAYVQGVLPDEASWLYTLTALGRQALAKLEKGG